ncbi:MAG TPA: AMP-binding protein [Rhizomicrobium sp.]|nr:AMP-binding protein [Rhizomicrobium sp.]
MREPSYVRGEDVPPLLELTIGAAMEEAARQWPDRPALVSPRQNVRWRWDELNARADALAAGFLQYGLGRGDRIGIWAPNCAEWALTQFAAAKIGLILVTINTAYRQAELEFALNRVGCKALVMATGHRGIDYLGMLRAIAPELASSAEGGLAATHVPALKLVVTMGDDSEPGCLPFSVLASTETDTVRVHEIAAALAPEDPINIQFTSGTTGFPKGATLSHRNILNNGFFVGARIGLTVDDRLCIPVPLYHCFGMVMGNLACVAHGAAMVYPCEGFEARAVLETVEAERCTVLYGVPTMFIAEQNEPDFARFDLSSLRTGIMAGSPCPIEVMRRVVSDMHMPEVTIAYGMTETSPVSFQSARNDSVEQRVTTVGRVHPHVEVKVVDEQGLTVPRGTPGEFCTRGYSVMLGYWNDLERTAEVIDAEGWMHTGDLGTIDDEGYGNVVGRIKDMVIRGGENIYPREVEEFLFRHPKIRDVQVVGVPDEKYGEELCAWIILRENEDTSAEEIRAFCREHISHHKIPRHIRFVDAFPMTVTGKVQKYLIREAMVAELGVKVAATA